MSEQKLREPLAVLIDAALFVEKFSAAVQKLGTAAERRRDFLKQIQPLVAPASLSQVERIYEACVAPMAAIDDLVAPRLAAANSPPAPAVSRQPETDGEPTSYLFSLPYDERCKYLAKTLSGIEALLASNPGAKLLPTGDAYRLTGQEVTNLALGFGLAFNGGQGCRNEFVDRLRAERPEILADIAEFFARPENVDNRHSKSVAAFVDRTLAQLGFGNETAVYKAGRAFGTWPAMVAHGRQLLAAGTP